jgi:hypothetical protein
MFAVDMRSGFHPFHITFFRNCLLWFFVSGSVKINLQKAALES